MCLVFVCLGSVIVPLNLMFCHIQRYIDEGRNFSKIKNKVKLCKRFKKIVDLRMFGDQTMARFLLVIPVISDFRDMAYRWRIRQSKVLNRG